MPLPTIPENNLVAISLFFVGNANIVFAFQVAAERFTSFLPTMFLAPDAGLDCCQADVQVL